MTIPITRPTRPRNSRPAAPPRLRAPAVLASLLGPGNFRRLARLTDRSHGNISRILSGKTSTRFASACLIADAAGVSLDEFRSYVESLRRQEKVA